MGSRIAGFLIAVALGVALGFGIARSPKTATFLSAQQETTPAPTPAPPPTPVPVPTPPPPPYVPNKRLDTGRLFSGLQYKVSVETEHGTTATADRNDPASYTLDLQVKVRVPKPHQSLADIARLNDKLPTILPSLATLLETAKVSPHFDQLYRLKVANLQSNLNRLDALITRHNFYDCETVLELQHPETKRRALFIQAEMDVDSDGSDSDRVPEIDGGSSTFQPFTSYRWDKKTQTPNSFITPREERLKQIAQELASSTISPARAKELKETQARMKSEIKDLQKFSFLVAATDPYVVMPGSIFGKKTPFSPTMGDYCVVIYDGVLYPSLIGDAGPTYKAGEAALRLCQQINPRASASNRPVSDLKVTYLVFPGTAEKPWDVPNLERWRSRCEALIGELGGHAGELFKWEDLTKPNPPVPPPATPVPAPTTSITPPATATLPPANPPPATSVPATVPPPTTAPPP